MSFQMLAPRVPRVRHPARLLEWTASREILLVALWPGLLLRPQPYPPAFPPAPGLRGRDQRRGHGSGNPKNIRLRFSCSCPFGPGAGDLLQNRTGFLTLCRLAKSPPAFL